MSPTQRLRLIVVTCTLITIFVPFSYGAYRAFGDDPFMLTVAGAIMLVTIGVTIFSVGLAGRLEKEAGQSLAQNRVVRILLWCGGIAFLLKLASAFIEGIAA